MENLKTIMHVIIVGYVFTGGRKNKKQANNLKS